VSASGDPTGASDAGRAEEPGPARPRLSAVFVDVPPETEEATIEFWSRTLGAQPRKEEEHPAYTELQGARSPLRVIVQRVEDAPRVHFDLESDDVEATVAHLVDLGAERVRAVHDWVVLRDPAGNLFCVVPPGYWSESR
jgi:catechol 2,3-dioxygenase-like lactoylglutathione lyase family enzyme